MNSHLCLPNDFTLSITGDYEDIVGSKLQSYIERATQSKISIEKFDILTSISHGKYAAVSSRATYNFETHVLKFGWKGNYSENYSAFKNRIRELLGKDSIAIIGISAVGSAAIRLAGELKNAKSVITICSRTSRGDFKLVSLRFFYCLLGISR